LRQVDDEQWLDAASAQALGLVARRWPLTRMVGERSS
jgi:hypothetical protein